MATSGTDLLTRMAAGDREAFAVFYDRYAPVVFPLILRIVRERADASDVLQEVFWEAWRDAPAYDAARGSPEAWMVTRARTRALDRIRATRRRGDTFVAPLDEGLAALARSGPPMVQRPAVKQELMRRLGAEGPGRRGAARRGLLVWAVGTADVVIAAAAFSGSYVASRYEAQLCVMARGSAAL